MMYYVKHKNCEIAQGYIFQRKNKIFTWSETQNSGAYEDLVQKKYCNDIANADIAFMSAMLKSLVFPS